MNRNNKGQFKKGNSGNPKGRPQNSSNKSVAKLRDSVNQLLNENFEQVQKDMEDLKPRERVKFFIDLLNYSLPRIKSEEYHMSDKKAKEIAENILQNIEKK